MYKVNKPRTSRTSRVILISVSLVIGSLIGITGGLYAAGSTLPNTPTGSIAPPDTNGLKVVPVNFNDHAATTQEVQPTTPAQVTVLTDRLQ